MANPGPKPGTRPSGRPKGAPNRQTVALKELIAKACGEDWDPVVAMAKIAREGRVANINPDTGVIVSYTDVDPQLRQKCAKEVAEYIHPKRKSIDIQTPPGEEIHVRVSNDLKAAEQLQAMLTNLAISET